MKTRKQEIELFVESWKQDVRTEEGIRLMLQHVREFIEEVVPEAGEHKREKMYHIFNLQEIERIQENRIKEAQEGLNDEQATLDRINKEEFASCLN